MLFPAPHHLHPNSPVYWFGMQIGMIIGSITAYPFNAWLIRAGAPARVRAVAQAPVAGD